MRARLLANTATALLLGLAFASLPHAGRALAAPPDKPLVTTAISERDYRTAVIAPHVGRVVLVSFWASYCLPCIEEMPGLLKLRDKLAKHGADIVFVNADGPGAPPQMMTGVLERRSIALGHTFVVSNEDPTPFLAAVDPSWSGQVPFHVVYGKDGARLRSLSGARPLAEIEAAVVAALGTPATPKP